MAVIGLMVLYKERASKVSVAFLALIMTGTLWQLSVGAMYSARLERLALFWAQIEHVGVAFIPSTLFYFTLIVLRRLERYRGLSRAGFILSGCFAITVFADNAFISGMMTYPWGRSPQYGVIGGIFLSLFLLQYAASLVLYWKAMRRLSPGPQRYRLKSFFVAFCVGFLGAIDYLAAYHIPVYPVGYLPVYSSLILLAQIIWLYGFPDITPAFAAPQIIANIPSGLFVYDHDGVICIMNEMACQMFGKTEAELVGTSMQNLFGPFLQPEHIDAMLTQGSIPDSEALIPGPEGRSRICRFSSSVIRDVGQRTLAHVCLVHDVTEQKQSGEALQASEARFRRVVESNIIGLIIVDGQNRITEANEAFLKMVRYTRHDLVMGLVGGPNMTPREYQVVDDWMQEKLQETGSCSAVEKEFIRKDGSRVPVLVGMVRLSPHEDVCVGFVIDATERRIARDALQKAYDLLEQRVEQRTEELTQEIARRQEAEEALRNQTLSDALTGLYNRRGFMTLADLQLKLASRNMRGFWLFMADMDNLKPINDSFGHAEGDRVLVQAADMLKQTFRESDIVARIGGDEFAIGMVEDPESSEMAFSKRLQDKLNEYNMNSGKPYTVGLSMGSVICAPGENLSIEDLMARADSALYEKKKLKSDKGLKPPPA